MKTPTVFDLCQPRKEVLEGRVSDDQFAADLAAVLDEHPDSVELWSPGGLLFPTGPDAPPGAPAEEVRRYPTLKAILDA